MPASTTKIPEIIKFLLLFMEYFLSFIKEQISFKIVYAIKLNDYCLDGLDYN